MRGVSDAVVRLLGEQQSEMWSVCSSFLLKSRGPVAFVYRFDSPLHFRLY